jgi:hypothetical protein
MPPINALANTPARMSRPIITNPTIERNLAHRAVSSKWPLAISSTEKLNTPESAEGSSNKAIRVV